MTREAMLALLERRDKAILDHDADGAAAVYGETAVLESPMSGQSVGREAIRRAHASLFEAFGTIQLEREQVLVDGDQMANVFKFTGTHTGTLFGLEGTGKRIAFRGVNVMTVNSEQIVYERRIYDFTGFLMKLGLLKARPA